MFGEALQRSAETYRRRVFDVLKPLLALDRPVATGLDFGSGDGWFAQQMLAVGLVSKITAVEVQLRKECLVKPILFDGHRLPFPDRSFDLTYSIDVLHHCEDPNASLLEAIRCTSRLLVVKDHTYRSSLGWLGLCILDELGNRRFGIPSPYRYQRIWEWFPLIEQNGFKLRTLIHPAPCHIGIMGRATNYLQFVAVWERQ
jgi:SAM-dependent methyltransferase